MHHGLVTSGAQGHAADYGRHAQFVQPGHESKYNGHKPSIGFFLEKDGRKQVNIFSIQFHISAGMPQINMLLFV